ncbi:hypothetical protein [Streptomyces sp. NBC_00259]|uniref:hypothetical protein n=1 Tax=Streptomyces sp. NBC_00259 TaxID=2903643 RepID=UPI002E2853E0|nr:hypothetical protein [Streptomyces sp. NBC_00259]
MSGSLWLKEPGSAGRDALPSVPGSRLPADRSEADPVDELAGRLGDFIAAAVHPDEIAALLESDGLTDEQIRLRYGREDSFALAEELYARAERRFPEPGGPPAAPTGPTLLACLLRGLVFTLPGLAHVLAVPLLAGGRPAYEPLIAAALAGWAWNQALAHRAYTWLGLGDRAAAARSLLLGAPVGALLGTASAVTAEGPMVLFAAGQSLYLVAATVLLVLGRDRALLLVLAPPAGGALFAALHPMPVWAHLALPLASVIAAVALAAWAVSSELRSAGAGGAGGAAGPGGPGDPGGKPGPAGGRAHRTPARGLVTRIRTGGRGRPRLGGSVPYGLFGLGAGVLVLQVALDTPPFAVALTLGMGPAEWLLHRFRADSLAGLRASTSPHRFRVTVAAALARCLAGHLGALLTLTAAATLLWPGSGHGPGGAALAGVLLLGVVLWTALLLQAFGAVTSAAVVCCAAALATVLVPGADLLLVPAAAAVVLVGLVCALLGRVTAHR